MGEVYRAIDTNLKRDVAIKVLPAELAGDAERLARFQREAEVLASLNHPNIAAIYGLEESEGTIALVLELVEGETLGERISRGPMPLDEALPIAKQIAEALDVAHRQGIIHRDLKPPNIKVTRDGVVKVLDFGIAKVLSAGDEMSRSAIATLSATQEGTILGTPAYMSPEQVRGEAADKRTDVWAFGCILYELLTARPAFAGKTVADTLATVLAHDIDWRTLPPAATPRIVPLLRKCLAKDPLRLHDHECQSCRPKVDVGGVRRDRPRRASRGTVGG